MNEEKKNCCETCLEIAMGKKNGRDREKSTR